MHYEIVRNHGCRISDAWAYRGVDAVVLENELIKVVVLVGKGADIYQFIYKPTDTDFMWRSPWGVRNPSMYVPTTGDGGNLWLDVYEGGWQTILPSGGIPNSYMGADLGQHAEVNTMPWDSQIIENSEEKVSVRCSVRAIRTPFFFEKTLSIKKDSSVLEIEATLTNEGEQSVHTMWGDHIAFGSPFLSDRCVIDISGGKTFNHYPEIAPQNDIKLESTGEWPWIEMKDGTQLDLRKVRSKDTKSLTLSYVTDMTDGWYSVTNQETGVGFGFVFPKNIFKYLWYWQSVGGGFGYPWYGRTYNIGLEPFTSYGHRGLTDAVENGTAIQLQPGESISASQCAVAFSGAKGIESIDSNGTVTIRKQI